MTASQGFALARSPDGDREPPAVAQHAPHFARAARRVGYEHQPFPAQHDVVGAVWFVDLLEIEDARADVAEPEAPGAPRRDVCHLGGEVGDDDLPAGEQRAQRRRSPRYPARTRSSSTRSPGRGWVSASSLSVTAAPRASA